MYKGEISKQGVAYIMFPIQERLLTVNSWSRPGTKLKAVKGIIIHWTANESKYANAEANRRFFENRKAGKTGFGSTQYIVDDKEILRCVPDNELCYQVGATTYKPSAIAKYGYYPNDSVIGIEMCVNSDADFKIVYEQTVKLTAYLMKKYKLGINTVDRHFDIMGKNCPAYFTSNHYGVTNNNFAVKYGLGPSADKAWDEFKDAVQLELAGKPQPIKEAAPVSKDSYFVRKGDSLSKIAQQHNVTTNDILSVNPVIKTRT